MFQQQLVNLQSSSKLLKYLAPQSAAFDHDAKTLTKAGSTFSSTFEVGDKIVIAGTSNNNGTFTVTAITATVITFSEHITDETSNCTLSGEYISPWTDIKRFVKLIGTVNCDQAAILYVDQSNDPEGSVKGAAPAGPSNVDYTTQLTVVASTALSFSIETVGLWARIRVQLNAATAFTIHRSYLNGRLTT
jgi:hypothetical protein